VNIEESVLYNLASVSLEELNAKASMLNRINNKYLVPTEGMTGLLQSLKPHFEILEINKKRTFLYQSCYFDDDKYVTYFAHHQGRRNRFKVRTRKYLDSGMCFLEVKLKSSRGRTIKRRVPYQWDKDGKLDNEAKKFISASVNELLPGCGFAPQATAVLQMEFKRITLAAKDGGERLTMDYGLTFLRDTESVSLPGDLLIVEVKSGHGHGMADRVMREHHYHKVKRCSKYCLGLNFMKQVSKNNRFLHVLRKLSGEGDYLLPASDRKAA